MAEALGKKLLGEVEEAGFDEASLLLFPLQRL